jgi:hypothetical protein
MAERPLEPMYRFFKRAGGPRSLQHWAYNRPSHIEEEFTTLYHPVQALLRTRAYASAVQMMDAFVLDGRAQAVTLVVYRDTRYHWGYSLLLHCPGQLDRRASGKDLMECLLGLVSSATVPMRREALKFLIDLLDELKLAHEEISAQN